MQCRVPLLLCALLVCAPVLATTPVAGQPQTDGTHLEAHLQPDGDADWNVTFAVPIDGDEEREAFEAFAARFESGDGDLDLGSDAFERAAAEASAASDREMSISAVRRDSEVRAETEDGDVVARYGVLRISFTWESFARIGDNGTLHVDDAFNTTDGTWLPGLSPDQSLTIRGPAGYGAPTTSPIGADGGDLRWDGPATFEPGYFTIVYDPSSPGATAGGLSNGLVVGALALSGAALVLGLYLLFARKRSEEAQGEGSRNGSTTTPEGDDNSQGGTPTPPAGDTDTPGGTSGDTDGDETDSPDPELLSDEERVEHLLERNGGRMKQATIVKETGWSNAKVSQLLSSMDDADRVEKLRIGRENLISLPGEGVGELDADDS